MTIFWDSPIASISTPNFGPILMKLGPVVFGLLREAPKKILMTWVNFLRVTYAFLTSGKRLYENHPFQWGITVLGVFI